MTDEEKEFIIASMIRSAKIRKTYDDYIIKAIPFETWVRSTVENLLSPKPIDVNDILDQLDFGLEA